MHHARTRGDPCARQLGGGAGREGGASRRAADRRRHRPDGRAELRPRAPRRRCSTSPACAELRDWSADDGRLRIGAGVTYTRLIDELGDRLPGPGHRVAHGRLAADPQPRDGRAATSAPPRRPATGCRRSTSPTPRSSSRARRARRRMPVADFVTGPKRNAARDDELIAAFHLPAATGRAAVRQDRHAQRDGHRRVLALAGHLARAPRGVRVHRLGRRRRRSGPARPRPSPPACSTRRACGRAARRSPTRRSSASARWWRAAAAPIDDVRGSAAYRRHALGVLGRRTLAWAWEEQRCA